MRRFQYSSMKPSWYKESMIFWSSSICLNSSSLSLSFSLILLTSFWRNPIIFRALSFFSSRFASCYSSRSSFFLRRWWDFSFVTAKNKNNKFRTCHHYRIFQDWTNLGSISITISFLFIVYFLWEPRHH